MSYTQTLYHIVLRTRRSIPAISPAAAPQLYSYIWGIIRRKKGTLYRINGMEDHIHIVSDLHPTIALADYVKDIKVSTSLWMKEKGLFPLFEGWSEGYCALTYSYKEKENIIEYVKNQQEHHKKETFHEEVVRFFKEVGMDIEGQFL